VSDVIRSLDDEVIDEPEDECSAHADGDDPAAELRPPPPDSETDQWPCEDDDVDEERTGEGEGDLGAGMRAAVCDVDREVNENTAVSAFPLVISGKTSDPGRV
jgi:hypothetical protein